MLTVREQKKKMQMRPLILENQEDGKHPLMLCYLRGESVEITCLVIVPFNSKRQ